MATSLTKKVGAAAVAVLGIFLGSFGLAYATSTFIVQQGGTGATSFTSSNLLYGAGTSPIQSVATTSVSCSGATSCTTFTAIGGSPITISSTASSGNVSTSTHETAGGVAYWTSNSATPALLGEIATTSLSNGTGISFTGTAGALLGGSNLTITNSSPLSGLSASFPFSFSNPTLTWLGLSTSSPGITSGQPIYATGVNTIASVASSTFLTSIGGQAAGNYITALTGDGTASGPGSAALTLATVNSNVGSFTNANITVNAKGLITAASSGSSSTGYWATGSNNIWNINSANVGIGTTTPSALLTLMASSTLPTENLLTLADSTGAPVFTVATSSSSLLGVGTSSPWRTLGVTGTVGFDGLTAGAGAGALCLSSNKEVVYSSAAPCTGSGAGTVTSIATTYPVQGGAITTTGTISLAFGTTTANSWSMLQSFSNATSTQFTAGSSNQFYINSVGEVTGYDTQGAFTGQITPARYLSFSLATSTAWTGTSSATSVYGDSATVLMPFAGKLASLLCSTNAGTLELKATLNSVDFYYPASTTAGIYSPSTTFTRGQALQVIGGNPATSPTSVNCTLGAYQSP